MCCLGLACSHNQGECLAKNQCEKCQGDIQELKKGEALKGVERPWSLAVAWQSAVHMSDMPPVLCISNIKHLPYLEHFGPYLFVVAVTSFQHSSQVIPGSSGLDLQHAIEYS